MNDIGCLIEVIRKSVKFDAVQIQGFFRGKHVLVFSQGYSFKAQYALLNDFNNIYPIGFSEGLNEIYLPLSISDSPEFLNPKFDKTNIYIENLNAQGFKDGITIELFHDDEYIGLIHFSSKIENYYVSDKKECIRKYKFLFEFILYGFSCKNIRNNGNFLIIRNKIIVSGYNDFVEENINLIDLVNSNYNFFEFYTYFNKKSYHIKIEKINSEYYLVSVSYKSFPRNSSYREMCILGWVMQGLTDKQISDRLGISVRTVNQHIRSLFKKFSCRNRVNLVSIAFINHWNFFESDKELNSYLSYISVDSDRLCPINN